LSLAHILASGLGAGASPKAPGTVGSLLGLALGALLMRYGLLPAGTLLATIAALWSIRAVLPPTPTHQDPGWIVIDEIAGQLLTMLALPRLTLPAALAAFALFRLFDITKPGPIGWADRQPGPTFILLDDLLAGTAAALTLLLLQTLRGAPL